MLLNNFFNILKAGYSHFFSNSNTWQDESCVITSFDGVSNNGWFYSYSNNGVFDQLSYMLGIASGDSLKSNANFRIAVGTDDTEPAATDYKLTSAVFSDRIMSANFAKTSDGKLTGSAVITNSAEGAVTFKEIGLILYGNFAVSSSSKSNKYVLVSREILDTPITLQPGESATLTVIFAWA